MQQNHNVQNNGFNEWTYQMNYLQIRCNKSTFGYELL